MRFLSITLAFAGTLPAAVSAAPVDASPVERFLTDRNPVHERPITEPRAPLIQCGEFQKIEEEGPMPLYANGHWENLEEATHMVSIINQSCGICFVFEERNAQGDIMWSGGPGQEAIKQVRGGQSYFCM